MLLLSEDRAAAALTIAAADPATATDPGVAEDPGSSEDFAGKGSAGALVEPGVAPLFAIVALFAAD